MWIDAPFILPLSPHSYKLVWVAMFVAALLMRWAIVKKNG